MIRHYVLTIALYILSATGFVNAQQPATDATRAANAAFANDLPWSDESEAVLAARGFIRTRSDPVIRNAQGGVAMDLSAFDFATGAAPETANPSLWRHLKLLRQHGLYKVTDRIYQVRGFDISVMTVILGDTGYIIVDPLTARETAAAALALVTAELGEKPVTAVIYTHSHADHCAGVKGIVSEVEVKAGRVPIIAPDGFMEHAISENLIAGPAMSRRANFQFGQNLPRGPAGQAGAGIGTGVSRGTISLIAPTRTIVQTGETLMLDGVKFEFQVTPGTEAPAEMNFFLPDLRALCLAENANASMHNILPPRGSLVRDAKAWADYLTQSQRLFGPRTEVLFVTHGWPRWGNAEVNDFIAHHRDAYKYLHDQSVRLMNAGFTAEEIAEQITLPPALADKWYNRGYYGTMAHNAKAVYQRYLGWYDANPVNLNAWPPEQSAPRYVKAMGGARKALRTAKAAYKQGDYRWAAEVASHIVFADQNDKAARELLAQAFEQMGYQAEGMLWRNMFLTGAMEARDTPAAPTTTTVAPDMIAAISTPSIFDLLAIRLDPARAAGKAARIDFVFPDRNERVAVRLANSVIVHDTGMSSPAQATVTVPRAAFLSMLFQGKAPAELIAAGTLKTSGDPAALAALLSSLDPQTVSPAFPIVTP
jgi:alkyl sulfatase BDS1-like metallo-beta-lactamase superfamily hydrolase